MPSRLDETPIDIGFQLNGQPVRITARPKRSALDVLREGLGVRTIKPGCSPQGLCGCCAALIDDKVRLTCTLPARSLEGKQVTTLEGLPEGERALLARAFADSGSLRCGYCVPGLTLQTRALLARSPAPEDDEIARALNGHLCRCTGWASLFDAVHRAAELRRADAPVAPPANRELALGEVAFVDDLDLPGTVHAALVWAPTGRVLRVDPSAALATEGVVAVLLAADLPDVPGMVRVGEPARAPGDAVAMVLAETRELAYGGRERVLVDVEPIEAGAVSGVVASARRTLGELNAALDEPGVVVVKASTRTQRVEPAFVESEATVAAPLRGGGLRVFSAGELPGDEKRALEALLGQPVEVEGVSAGGAFGARRGVRLQALAALAAQRLKRPVKLSTDMEEGMRVHDKRPAVAGRAMLGVRPDGRMVGLKALVNADVGLGEGEAVVRAISAQLDATYEIPHLDAEVRATRSDAPGGAALVGAGSAEVAFWLEAAVDRAAEQLGVDGAALRRANLRHPGAVRLLDALAGLPGVSVVAAQGHIATPLEVELRSRTGEVELLCALGDVGQGLHAALVQRAAARTGLPATQLTPRVDAHLAGGAEHAPFAVACAGRALELALSGWGPGQSVRAAWPAAPETLHAAIAAAVVLDEAGKIARVVLACPAGADEVALRCAATGAALLGLGAALSEEIPVVDGAPDLRLRNLGVIKASGAPKVEVIFVDDTGLCPEESAELAAAALPPATAAALRRRDGQDRSQLPMKDNPAAWGVGVRRTKGSTA